MTSLTTFPSLANRGVSPYVGPARDILTHLLLGYRLELCLTALSEMEKELGLRSPSGYYPRHIVPAKNVITTRKDTCDQ